MIHETVALLSRPSATRHASISQPNGNEKPKKEQGKPYSAEEVEAMLQEAFSKQLQESSLVNSFNNPLSRLPGRNEFFIKPPTGLGYKLNVEKSIQKIAGELEDRANDGTVNKLKVKVQKKIGELVNDYAGNLDKFKWSSLGKQVDNELEAEIEAIVEKLVEDKKFELYGQFDDKLDAWEKEFNRKFPQNLNGDDKKEYEKLDQKNGGEVDEFRQSMIKKHKAEQEAKIREGIKEEIQKYREETALPEAQLQLEEKRENLKRRYLAQASHRYAKDALVTLKRYI